MSGHTRDMDICKSGSLQRASLGEQREAHICSGDMSCRGSPILIYIFLLALCSR